MVIVAVAPALLAVMVIGANRPPAETCRVAGADLPLPSVKLLAELSEPRESGSLVIANDTRALAAARPWSYTVAVISVESPAEMSVLLVDTLMLLALPTVSGTATDAPPDRTKVMLWLPFEAVAGKLNV